MTRGEIWWATLPEPSDSEPGYRRPVLVIQSNAFNRSRLQTVVVVALTGNLKLAAAPGNVLFPARDTNLPRDCVANLSQVLTLDRSFLTECVGSLPERLLERVGIGLGLVLDL